MLSSDNLLIKTIKGHVHQFSAETDSAKIGNSHHDHYLSGVTGKAIIIGDGNHIHRLTTQTVLGDHQHDIDLYTGPAIPTKGGRHVHKVLGESETSRNHAHKLNFTLPDEVKKECKPKPPHKCPKLPQPTLPEPDDRCPFPTPNLDCPGFPQAGTCVPAAAGFKAKQNVQSKVERLAENMVAPSVLTTTFFEIARRFFAGQEPTTPVEASIYNVLNDMSPDVRDICRCALNSIAAIPTAQKNRLFSPEINANTVFSVENLANLLAEEIVQIAGQNLMNDPTALTNPRPGRMRPTRGTPEFPGSIDPFIYFINGIRTIQAVRADQPTAEETERECVINQQNQQVCTALTENCPGNSNVFTNPDNPVCFLVQQVLPGDLVVLQGANYFTTEAKVIMTNKDNPGITRELPTIVFGDVDTPVYDDQGNLIDDERVQDRLLFAIPEDLPDGIYSIVVEVENTNQQAGPVGVYTSLPEFLRVLPPPSTTYQILAESLICVENTSGPGSDEVALNFFTSLLVRNPDTGNIDLTPLTSQEIRFGGLDADESRVMNYAPVQAGNLFGVVISLQGFEVDNEDLYKERVSDFEAAYKAGLESVWAQLASSLTSAVGSAIAVAIEAAAAAASVIIAAAAAVIVAAVALFYALWAPADPIIEDNIGLTLVDLATLTDNSTPMPPQVQYVTPQEIRVVVDSLSKNIEFRQLRGFISEEEESLYQIIFRYSRI